MTSKFLHQENSAMLWNVMKETPFFLKDFTDSKARQHWFESIMYQFNENKNYSVEGLNALNHKVIKFMMTELKTNNDINTKNLAKSKITEMETIKPPILDSEPITNMDELIKSHINERNLVLDQVFNNNSNNNLNNNMNNNLNNNLNSNSNLNNNLNNNSNLNNNLNNNLNSNNHYNSSLDLQDSITDLSNKKVTFYNEPTRSEPNQQQISLLQDNFQEQITILQNNFQQQIHLLQQNFQEKLQKIVST